MTSLWALCGCECEDALTHLFHRTLLREGRPRAQYGESRPRRRLRSRRSTTSRTSQSTSIHSRFMRGLTNNNVSCIAGGENIVFTEMHSVVVARQSVQRHQLQASELPEDEVGVATLQGVQRRLSFMQATDQSLLLPRKAVPGTVSFNFLCLKMTKIDIFRSHIFALIFLFKC